MCFELFDPAEKLLTGTLLAGVGCKDYDDDIKEINNKIEGLETGKLASLEEQLNSLKVTISTLEQADKDLQQKINEQEKAISSATGDIEQLEKELEKAVKAHESLQTNIDNLKKYCDGAFLKTADAAKTYATIASVADAVALAKNLKVYNTDAAIKKAIDDAVAAAVNANGAAFQAAFDTRFTSALDAALSSEAGKEGKIYQAITTAISQYDGKMHQCLTDALAENGVITNAIADAIADAKTDLTAELQKWVSGRLTSVTMIPDLYENGIETIEVNSLRYKKMKVNTSTETAAVTPATEKYWYISEKATPVRYHVSPSVVTNSDIETPSFVFEQAVSRSAVGSTLLSVVSNTWSTEAGSAWNIKSNELTVNTRRVAGYGLVKPAPENNIYTAALKVPIAEKWLEDDADDTFIYSDYTKLSEYIYDVKIAALRDDGEGIAKYSDTDSKHYHFYETYKKATDLVASKPAATCDYDETIDLLTLVTGCATNAEGAKAREINKAALAVAGLEFRFAVPTVPFKRGENEADNQKYIKLNGSVATPVTPEGTENNQAAIGKTPVVRVELWDAKRNEIVDVKWLQLKWTQKTFSFPIDKIYTKLGCSYTYKFLWDDMNKHILEKMGESGMSQADFVNTYKVAGISTTDKWTERNNNTGLGKVVTDKTSDDYKNGNYEMWYGLDANAAESTPAFEWHLTADQIGKIIDLDGKLLSKYKDGKDMFVTINLVRKDGNVDGGLTITFGVNFTVELKATVTKNTAWWHSDYAGNANKSVKVTPIHINTANPEYRNGTVDKLVNYEFDLTSAFTDKKPLANMNNCAVWDIQFSKTQPVTDFKVNFNPATAEPQVEHNNDDYGYVLQSKTLSGNASRIQFNGSQTQNAWFGIDNGKSVASEISVFVGENTAGYALLGQRANAKIWGSINPKNIYLVETFELSYVAPLKFVNDLGVVELPYAAEGQTIDCAEAISIRDFQNYLVAAKAPVAAQGEDEYAPERYKYYDVKTAQWNFAEAVVNQAVDAQGNISAVSIEGITADNYATEVAKRKLYSANSFFKMPSGQNCFETNAQDATKLDFHSLLGNDLGKEVSVLIPVSVQHKYGVAKTLIQVKVKPVVLD